MSTNKLSVLVIGLIGVMFKDSGDIMSDEFRVIYLGRKQSKQEIGIALNKEARQCVSQVECLTVRQMTMRLKGKLMDKTIMVVHIIKPTSDHEDEKVETASAD